MPKKLEISFDYDFELIGITCDAPEYKLAWELNTILNQRFIKQQDYKMSLKKYELKVINYLSGNENLGIRIIKNKCFETHTDSINYLIPESKMFDYFLLVYGLKTSLILQKLKMSKLITYSKEIIIDTLASKENLLLN